MKLEANTDIKVYCAVGKESHHKTLNELFDNIEPVPPDKNAVFSEKMKYRLKTKEGKAIYKLRKQTVEPVYGIIKSAIGFREFRLRGLEKVITEFELVKNAYNIKRLFNLMKMPKIVKV